jgi:hypothetical protein
MFLDPRSVEAKFSARLARRWGWLFVIVMAIMGWVEVAGASYAGDARNCVGDGACPPDQSSEWRPAYLAQFPTSSDTSAVASDSVMPGSGSIDSKFEAYRDSAGLILYKGDTATTAELGAYQLTWHDAPLTAIHASGLLRLQSETLQAAFNPLEGIHLDVNFGGIARYLHQQNPIGAVEASGKIGENELDVSVSRQLQTDSLAAIRRGIFINRDGPLGRAGLVLEPQDQGRDASP